MRNHYARVKEEIYEREIDANRNREYEKKGEMYDKYSVIENYVLPAVGFWMADHDVEEIAEDELRQILEDRQDTQEPEWYWDIYLPGKGIEGEEILDHMDAEEILKILVDDLKLMSVNETGSWQFVKTRYRDYFAGFDIYGKLKCVAEVVDEIMDVETEEIRREILEYSMKEIMFFETKEWSKRVLHMAAGHFGIIDNAPVYGLDGWYTKGTPGMTWVFNLFRRVPENPVMEIIQERRALNGSGEGGYLEKNFIEMLRQGRNNGKYIDFAGIDFHGIDLTKTDMSNVVFFHKLMGEPWGAILKDTGIETMFR